MTGAVFVALDLCVGLVHICGDKNAGGSRWES
ncbi:hypothetical protein SAMN05444404_1070 [Ruegeria lacuscaerulensis ITI-1157]|nr:hypothetical protein SAMN05444404_1070 [Ruegeria lacuscaerulensis ITI-1157]